MRVDVAQVLPSGSGQELAVADLVWDACGMLLLALTTRGEVVVFSRDGFPTRVVSRQLSRAQVLPDFTTVTLPSAHQRLRPEAKGLLLGIPLRGAADEDQAAMNTMASHGLQEATNKMDVHGQNGHGQPVASVDDAASSSQGRGGDCCVTRGVEVGVHGAQERECRERSSSPCMNGGVTDASWGATTLEHSADCAPWPHAGAAVREAQGSKGEQGNGEQGAHGKRECGPRVRVGSLFVDLRAFVQEVGVDGSGGGGGSGGRVGGGGGGGNAHTEAVEGASSDVQGRLGRTHSQSGARRLLRRLSSRVGGRESRLGSEESVRGAGAAARMCVHKTLPLVSVVVLGKVRAGSWRV